MDIYVVCDVCRKQTWFAKTSGKDGILIGEEGKKFVLEHWLCLGSGMRLVDDNQPEPHVAVPDDYENVNP